MTTLARSAVIIGAVVLLDRATKIYIRSNFSLLDVVPVITGFFYIDHTENPGAAWGVLGDSGPWRRVVLVGVSMAVMAVIGTMLWKRKPTGMPATPVMDVALSLVFGGALGNLWDRVFRGTVTDFLQFFFGSYEFPSFNVADSAVFCGAVLMLIDMLRSSKKESSV